MGSYEGCHEPLVDMELYRKTVEIREKIAQKSASHKHPTKGYPIEENIFDSVLYCGVYGRKMTRSSYVKEYADGDRAHLDGYFCLNGGGRKVTVYPDSNRISKAELTEGKIRCLHEEGNVYVDYRAGNISGKDYVAYKMKQEDKLIDLRKIDNSVFEYRNINAGCS